MASGNSNVRCWAAFLPVRGGTDGSLLCLSVPQRRHLEFQRGAWAAGHHPFGLPTTARNNDLSIDCGSPSIQAANNIMLILSSEHTARSSNLSVGYAILSRPLPQCAALWTPTRFDIRIPPIRRDARLLQWECGAKPAQKTRCGADSTRLYRECSTRSMSTISSRPPPARYVWCGIETWRLCHLLPGACSKNATAKELDGRMAVSE